MRVEKHHDQNDHIAKQNGAERMPRVHADRDETGGKHVRGYAHAHPYPKRRVVVHAPSAPLRMDWSKAVLISEVSGALRRASCRFARFQKYHWRIEEEVAPVVLLWA